MAKDNKENRTLSIRISTDGFCFCSYTPENPGSIRYSFYTPDTALTMAANLQRAIDACNFISRGERYEVKVIVEVDEFTTLPAEYDDRQEYKSYYRLCFPRCDARIDVFANKLNAQGVTVIFPVEKSLCELLQTLGDVSYYTPVSILLGMATRMSFPESRYMLVYMYNDKSILISINDGKLQLANAFGAGNGQDNLYYLLSIWKQQGLSQTDDVLYMCGDKGVEMSMMLTRRFIKNCRRMNATEMFPSNLLNKMEGIPFDLQVLMLCE